MRTIIQPIPQYQLSGQSQNFLSGQKNTIPKGLNSYNFGSEFDFGNIRVKLLYDAVQRLPGQHATIAPPRFKH